MHQFLSCLPLLSALRSDSRRSSDPTWFTVTANRKDPIMVQRIFRALRNTLPLIVSAQHPVLICISIRVDVDIKMSRHGLRNNGWRRDVGIGLAGVPDSVAASRVRSKRMLAYLIRDRGAPRLCAHKNSTIRARKRRDSASL